MRKSIEERRNESLAVNVFGKNAEKRESAEQSRAEMR
jgi:hypothetical protein